MGKMCVTSQTNPSKKIRQSGECKCKMGDEIKARSDLPQSCLPFPIFLLSRVVWRGSAIEEEAAAAAAASEDRRKAGGRRGQRRRGNDEPPLHASSHERPESTG